MIGRFFFLLVATTALAVPAPQNRPFQQFLQAVNPFNALTPLSSFVTSIVDSFSPKPQPNEPPQPEGMKERYTRSGFGPVENFYVNYPYFEKGYNRQESGAEPRRKVHVVIVRYTPSQAPLIYQPYPRDEEFPINPLIYRRVFAPLRYASLAQQYSAPDYLFYLPGYYFVNHEAVPLQQSEDVQDHADSQSTAEDLSQETEAADEKVKEVAGSRISVREEGVPVTTDSE